MTKSSPSIYGSKGSYTRKASPSIYSRKRSYTRKAAPTVWRSESSYKKKASSVMPLKQDTELGITGDVWSNPKQIVKKPTIKKKVAKLLPLRQGLELGSTSVDVWGSSSRYGSND